MKTRLLAALSVFTILTGMAFASGPMHEYEDISLTSDAWYADSVYSMMSRGVFEANTIFDPEGLVNRAQMAAMLDRLYTAILSPKGNAWTMYENDSYSVLYPSDYRLSPRGSTNEFYAEYNSFGGDDCSSGLSGIGDYTFFITCSDETLDELVAQDLTSATYYTVQDLNVNGANAKKVVKSFSSGSLDADVYIEGTTQTFKISGGYADKLGLDFEKYYTTFKVK